VIAAATHFTRDDGCQKLKILLNYAFLEEFFKFFVFMDSNNTFSFLIAVKKGVKGSGDSACGPFS
jgi:hypothetical protein